MTTVEPLDIAAGMMNDAAGTSMQFWGEDAYKSSVGQPPLPQAVNVAWHSYTTATAAAGTAVRDAVRTVQQLRANDTIHPDGRNRLVREAIDGAQTALGDRIRQADNAVTVLRAVLEEAALPRVVAGNEQLARTDARMLLDASRDPVTDMMRLAARQDDIGALVVSGWGRDYLATRGHPQPALHEAVRQAGVDAALTQTADPARARAATYVARVVSLEQARDELLHGAGVALRTLAGKH